MGEITPHPSMLLFSLSVQVSCLALGATLHHRHLKRDILAVAASTGCMWSSTYPGVLTELCLSCSSTKGDYPQRCPLFHHWFPAESASFRPVCSPKISASERSMPNDSLGGCCTFHSGGCMWAYCCVSAETLESSD